MKKLVKMLLVVMIAMLGLVGCDNNEGPFETRLENGTRILYSNGKPAKGWVSTTETSYETGDKVISSEILYENGLPTGEFVLRDEDGNEVLISECKRNENGQLEGKMEATCHLNDMEREIVESFGLDTNDCKAKGIFNVNLNVITEYNTKDSVKVMSIPTTTLITGEMKIFDKNGKPLIECGKKNGKEDGKWKIYYEENGVSLGTVKEELYFKNGISIEYKSYYEDGKLFTEGHSDEKGNINYYKQYYTNGNLLLEKLYDENGNVKSVKKYHIDGKLISEN